MPSSWGSQCTAWANLTDSSSSESENPQSWSNFTDSDQVMHSNAPYAQSPAIPVQVHSDGSWSSCTSWSTSDWSSCPPWSTSGNNSNHQEENWEAASLQSCLSSQPSNKCDEDYNPGSTFSPLIPAPKPQSESNASDHITQPSQAIGRTLYILLMH
ncbi:MAG: hypothetical protein QOJ12_3517 [Thermoleophilales bacterium]|jgi:hypothetical protein|nr:hypothetical protein [Thermoleophilales bacterium]